MAAALLAFAGSDAKDKGPTQKAPATSKTAPSKAVAAKTAAPMTTAPKGTASKTNVALTSKSYTKAKPKQAATISRRSTQVQPTPDRYKEIQQALSEKGYFAGPADGNWGPDSIDAMKRFQHDQNLTEDGKIGSLSLIALGLGPKRDAAPAVTPQGSGIQ